MSFNPDLALIWAFILAFAVFAYVVMDGFDLGIGILFPTIPVGPQRDTAMNSVAPFWDGNETWLVLGGGGLMAVFPLAYAIILPALYIPIITMVLALVFRGVAFEYRWRDTRHRAAWDIAFSAGSLVAALMQGIALGAILQGIEVEGRSYAGGWWDWLTTFSLLVGLSVVTGYSLLGAAWLIMRTEGELQDRAFRYAWWLATGTVSAIILVSVITPFLEQEYWRRWFEMPGVIATAQVPLLLTVGTFLLFRSLSRRQERAPFLLSLTLFFLCFMGLGVSIYPDIVPGAVSIRDGAAPESSLLFVLVGASFLIPLILAYTGWAYWVFRGKTGHEGYH